MPRGQMFRGGYFLRTACHSSQAAFVTSNRRRRRFSAGGLSRAAVNCLYAFSSSRKNLWSRSTAVASRQAASSMNSDRFFPSFSAARSMRDRLTSSARRLIVTPRPTRFIAAVFAIAFLLYIQILYRSVYTTSTQNPGHRKRAHRSHGHIYNQGSWMRGFLRHGTLRAGRNVGSESKCGESDCRTRKPALLNTTCPQHPNFKIALLHILANPVI